MQPAVGAKVGRFTLMRPLDTDAQRVIWLGSHDAFGTMELAAIDLPAGDGPDPARATALHRESEVAQHLQHDGVQRVLEVGELDGQCWIAREHVEGITLDRLHEPLEALRATDDPLRLACIADMIASILEILAHTHGVRTVPNLTLGVTHGQLTARDVLVSTHGTIKIAGFGLDRRPGDGTAGLMTHDALRALAPELLAGVPLQPTADLYAVGILLHGLLDGRPPWSDREGIAVYQAIISGEQAKLQEPAPPELVALHAALVTPNMTARIATAEAAIDLLQRWASSRPEPRIDVGDIVRQVLNPPPARDLFDELSGTSAELRPVTATSAADPALPSHVLASPSDPAPAGLVSPPFSPPVPPSSHSALPTKLEPETQDGPVAAMDEGTLMLDANTLARMRAEALAGSTSRPAPSPSAPSGAVAGPVGSLLAEQPARAAMIREAANEPSMIRPQAIPERAPVAMRPAAPPFPPVASTGSTASPTPSRFHPALESAGPRSAHVTPSVPVGEGTTTAMLIRRERRSLGVTLVAGSLVALVLAVVIAYLIIS
jgi:hypothetical protein